MLPTESELHISGQSQDSDHFSCILKRGALATIYMAQNFEVSALLHPLLDNPNIGLQYDQIMGAVYPSGLVLVGDVQAHSDLEEGYYLKIEGRSDRLGPQLVRFQLTDLDDANYARRIFKKIGVTCSTLSLVPSAIRYIYESASVYKSSLLLYIKDRDMRASGPMNYFREVDFVDGVESEESGDLFSKDDRAIMYDPQSDRMASDFEHLPAALKLGFPNPRIFISGSRTVEGGNQMIGLQNLEVGTSPFSAVVMRFAQKLRSLGESITTTLSWFEEQHKKAKRLSDFHIES